MKTTLEALRQPDWTETQPEDSDNSLQWPGLTPFLVLVFVVRLLIATDKPILCALIYSGAAFLLDLVFGNELASTAISAGVDLVAALVYFWLLNQLDSDSLAW